MESHRCRFGRAMTLTVVTLLATSMTAHSGMTEWEAHLRQGMAEHELGNYDRAEYRIAAAVTEAEATFGEGNLLAQTLNFLGSLHLSRGNYAAAEPPLTRALAIREKIADFDHPDLARSQNNLATLYVAQGKLEKAEPLLKRSLAIRTKVFGREHRDVAASLDNLAMLYSAQGKYAQAESLFKSSIEIWKKRGDSRNLANSERNLTHLRAKMTTREGKEVAPGLSFGINFESDSSNPLAADTRLTPGARPRAGSAASQRQSTP